MPCAPFRSLSRARARVVVLALIADEALRLGERRRPQEVGIGLHRVALGDAAAAHDAERLLADVRLLHRRRDEVLLVGMLLGLQERLDRAHLGPERLHVDDQVLDHRQVAHRRDRGHVAALDERLHGRLAGQHRAAVHAHAAGAADRHAARLAIGQRAVALVLDRIEGVQQRGRLGHVDRVRLDVLRGAVGRAPDLEGDFHPQRPFSNSAPWARSG